MTPDVTDDMVIACMTRSPRIRRLIREITEEVAVCLVRKTGIQERTANLPERVIAAVAERFGVTEKQLRGQSRVRAIAEPRMVAMAVMRSRGMSYPSIGQSLGGRDHSTVISGCAAVEERQALRLAAVDVRLKLDGQTVQAAEPTE